VAETSDRQLRFKRNLNRWPFWARFAAFAGPILGFWLIVFAYLGIVVKGMAALAGFIAIHYVLTWLFVGLGKVRTAYGRWAADRRQRREARVRECAAR